jgi:hypothetical protein
MKNNIAYMLLSALILVALPAGCASKKNKTPKTEHAVTLNNDVDSISILEINETSSAVQDASVIEEAHTENLSKF